MEAARHLQAIDSIIGAYVDKWTAVPQGRTDGAWQWRAAQKYEASQLTMEGSNYVKGFQFVEALLCTR